MTLNRFCASVRVAPAKSAFCSFPIWFAIWLSHACETAKSGRGGAAVVGAGGDESLQAVTTAMRKTILISLEVVQCIGLPLGVEGTHPASRARAASHAVLRGTTSVSAAPR